MNRTILNRGVYIFNLNGKKIKLAAYLFCLLIIMLMSQTVRSQVATGYIWSQSMQTYTAGISTTSVTPANIFYEVWDDVSYTSYKFPFNFTYNGVLYTAGTGTIGVDTDGWIAFSLGAITMNNIYAGDSWVSATDHTGVYLNGSANNNGFCGFNGDMTDQVFSTFTGSTTNGSTLVTGINDFTSIRVGERLTANAVITDGTVINVVNVAAKTITLSAPATASGVQTLRPRASVYAFIRGIAPYRQFVIQWTRASRYSVVTGDDFSFQLVLNEGGGNPNFQTLQSVYGTLTLSSALVQKSQVGLRGAAKTDFNARTTTSNWSGTTAAAANTATCTVSTSVFPASGLTYIWSPPCPAVFPSAAGAITGTNPVCPTTIVDYSLPGVPGAIKYIWTYTGGGTTLSGETTLPLNTLNFGSTATGGTLTVTPWNLCGAGAPSSLVITMNATTPATISYGAASYCISTAGTVSPTLSGTSGGTYTSSPLGLSMTIGGVITPSSSTAGTYTITYTYVSGSCTGITATTSVTILANPTISVTATPTIVCTNGTTQLQAVGEAAGNYTVSAIPYLPPLIPDGGTNILWDATADEDISPAIPMPFSFGYYGQNITQLYVYANGYIQLQATDPSSTTAQAVPNPATPNNTVALTLCDLKMDTATLNKGAQVQYFVNGITPNRIMVIDYFRLSANVVAGSAAGKVSGQIRLYENDNHIEIAADTVDDAGMGLLKTLGIENNLGTVGQAPVTRNNAVWNNAAAPEAWSFKPKIVSYAWTATPGPGTFSSTIIANPVATVTATPTTYKVVVNDASSGCSATASVVVTTSAPLNGVKLVGAGGDYTTLTAAVNAYNTLCISGPVTFSLTAAAYTAALGEVFPITINNTGTPYTLTIKPAAGMTPLITGKNTKAILRLNAADRIIIDGSNTAGGTTRNLTFTNTSGNVNSNIIWLNSIAGAPANGATNDTIKNCIITGSGTNKTYRLILSSGSTAGNIAQAANANNCYKNNLLTKAQKGIVLVGPAGNETNTLISGNFFGNVISGVAGDKLGWSAIDLYQQASCQVRGNYIAGAVADFEMASGISVFGTASGITISENKISDIKNTSIFGCTGIYLGSTSSTANVSVINNFISDVAAYGYAGRTVDDNGYGIAVDGGAGYKIYFNTVHLNTNQTDGAGFPSSFLVTSNVNTANAIDLRNNIFSNVQTLTGSRYAIEATSGNNVFSSIDFNDYAAPNLGYIGANRNTIAAIRTNFGQNVSSISFLPTYVGASDFHVSSIAGNSTLSNKGTPITGITTDYDTTTRNGLTPDMGADEWLMPNTGSWVGKTSIDWLTPTNWETNKIPDSTIDVTITGGYTFLPTLITSQTIRKLYLTAPALATPLLTINGGTLRVFDMITRPTGTVPKSGQIDGSNGTLEMDSTIALTIPDSLFVNFNLKNLVIGNSNNVTGITLGGRLDIYRSLTFLSTGKKLTTNDSLKFKSTATGTAWLGDVTGKTIVGQATVERYIPTGINHGKSWQLLAVPVSLGQSVKASWQENNAPLGNSAGPGNYGTTISSAQPNAVARGFDFYTPIAGPVGGPSIKTYDPITDTFKGIDDLTPLATTTSLNIYDQRGYMVFVRGDRSVINFSGANSAAVPTTLRARGRLFTATPGQLPPTTTVLSNKFASVGNPYASAIDFQKVGLTGVDTLFYVWDPFIAGSNNLGGYQTFSKTTGYLPSVPNANYPNVVTTRIQSGQAFFVHNAKPASGTVSFTEAVKDTGSRLVQRPNDFGNRQFLRTYLYKVSTSDLGPVDGNTVAFDPAFSNSIDYQDALKLYNPSENAGILSHEKILAIEARKPVVNTDTIFYSLGNLRPEEYQFKFVAENMLQIGLTAYLGDNFLHVQTPVILGDTSTVNFTVTADAGSFAADRFYLVFRQLVIVPVTITHIAATRTREKNIIVDWNVANETSVDRYEIEGSADGRNFGRLSSALPKLNNGGSAGYVFMDEHPFQADNYYRIKLLNNSGQLQYSPIVKVAAVKEPSSISVYPNPIVNKVLSVSFVNQDFGNYHLELMDKLGRKIFSRSIEVNDGSSTTSILLGNSIASGNYQLSISPLKGKKTILQVIVN